MAGIALIACAVMFVGMLAAGGAHHRADFPGGRAAEAVQTGHGQGQERQQTLHRESEAGPHAPAAAATPDGLDPHGLEPAVGNSLERVTGDRPAEELWQGGR